MTDAAERKPRSRGKINPTEGEMIPRHIGRIKTLRLAIKQCDDVKRKASLQAELDRRLAAINELKAQLEDL